MTSVQRQPIRSGAYVSFRLGDAICPTFGQIITQISPDVQVCGEVAFFSDRGRDVGHFAIITVEGVVTPLVVPVGKLEPFAARSSRTAAAQGGAAPETFDPLERPPGRREVG